MEKVVQSGQTVSKVTTSDHYFIKFTLPVNAQGGKIEPRIVEKDVCEYSKIAIGNFKEDLFFSPINSTEFTSVNDAVDIYLKTVENLLDKHAPCIQEKFNLRRSPWWNIQCQKARTDARKAQRHHNKDPSNVELKEIYNEKCKDKAFLIDKARNLYYDQKFSLVKNDPKETYKLINKLLDREYGSNKLPDDKDD